jgi:hypothetical protein
MRWYPASPIDTNIARPISPTYQSVLRREMETLFGTANHTTPSVLVHPVCLSYLCCLMCISHVYWQVRNNVTSMTADHGFSTEDVSICVLALRLCGHTTY